MDTFELPEPGEELILILKGPVRDGRIEHLLRHLITQNDCILKGLETIMSKEQDALDFLTAIGGDIDGIATDVTTIATDSAAISTAIDGLITAANSGNIGNVIDAANALKLKADAQKTALDAAVSALGAVTDKASGKPPVLATPQNVVATVSAGSVALVWDAVDGATSYDVFRTETGTPFGPNALSTATTTSASDSTATAGTSYDYAVEAVNDAARSAASTSVTVIGQ